MAQTIKLKRSATSGAVPTTASLALGEVAINTYDGKVYIKKDDGAESVIEVGDTSGYLPLSGGTLTGDIALGDNDKATFGTSDDLQIFHDPAAGSVIQEGGAGSLFIRASSNIQLEGVNGENMAIFNENGSVQLYHNSAEKLATTSTGIDVTGTVLADALTLDSTNNTITFGDANTSIRGASATGGVLQTKGYNGFSFTQTKAGDKTRFNIADGGNVSFYEDTGTTAKMVWDASAESLSVGSFFSVSNTAAVNLTNVLAGSGSAGSPAYTFGSDQNTGIYRPTTDTLAVTTAGSEKMRIDASGNLLVGTSNTTWNSAEGLRYFNGDALIVTRNADAPLFLNRLSSDGAIAEFTKDGSTVGSIGTVGGDLVIDGAADHIRLHVNGSERLNINQDSAFYTAVDGVGSLGLTNRRFQDLHLSGTAYVGGNVGIGTTSPANSLTLDKNDNNFIQIRSSDTGNAGIYFGRQNDSVRGAIVYDNSNESIQFLNNNYNEKMRIDSSGNVGIGESNPQELLHLTATTPVFRMQGGSRTYQQFVSGTDFVIRDVNAGLNRVTLNSSGNVGIGTSSPLVKLHIDAGVARTSTAKTYTSFLSTNDSDFKFGLVTAFKGGATSADRYVSLDHTTYNVSTSTFAAGGSLVLQELGGNVGIGTSSPTTALDARGGINSAHATFTGQASRGLVISTANTLSNDDGVVYNAQTAGSGKHIFQTAGTERMRIDSSGNLLVGKTSTSLGTAGIVNYPVGLFRATRSSGYPLELNRTSTDGDIALFRKDGTTVGSIGIEAAGFTIDGETGHTGLQFGSSAIIPRDNGSNTDGANDLGASVHRFKDLYLSGIANTGGVRIDNTDSIRPTSDTSLITLSGGNATNSGANYSVFGGSHSSNPNIHRWRIGSTEAMRIDSSGNLLVGTTNPLPGYSNTVEGVSVREGSHILASRSEGASGYFNRNTNDGNIVEFRKDGTSVGSIGVGAGALGIGQGTGNLGFFDATIVPMSNTSGGGSNGVINLGNSGRSFKDLHLSGTAYVGTSVGIGTTSPSSYSANANNLVVYEAGNGGITIANGTSNEGALYFADGTSGADVARGVVYYSHATNHMGFSTDSTERMRIDSSGNVGIGTSNPERKVHIFNGESSALASNANSALVIEDDSNAYISFLSPNFLEAGLLFGDSADNDAGSLTYNHLLDRMSIRAGGSSVLSVESTGIDVTGTAKMDGLTVTGSDAALAASIGTAAQRVYITPSGTVINYNASGNSAGSHMFQTGNVSRLNIASNGDISFYEDTGTTPKFFWDASSTRLTLDGAETSRSNNTYLLDIDNSAQTSNMATSGPFRVKGYYGDSFAITGAGNVGIGTSSPSDVLHVKATADTSGAPIVGLSPTATNNIQGGLGCLAGGELQVIGTNLSTFYTAGSERMRIDSSGNVGIGTSSPTFTLEVNGGGAADNLKVESQSTLTNFYQTTAGGTTVFQNNNGNMAMFTGGAERMRIDSSGNLLVGTTALTPGNGNTDTGHLLKNDGRLFVSSASNSQFNRNSDGDIVAFRQSGNLVGSIGTNGGDLYIGTGDTALRFLDASDFIYPVSTSTGTARDNAIDLGYSTGRFKDLYLSGGLRGDTLTFKNIAGSENMRLFSNGNLSIGTTSSIGKLTVSNNGAEGIEFFPANITGGNTTQHYNRSGSAYLINNVIASEHRFLNSGAEKMRLNSAGHLLHSTTSTTPTTGGTSILGGNASLLTQSHATGTSPFGFFQQYKYNSSIIGSIARNGNTGVYFVTSSDERLKENIADSDDAGSKIDAIQVRKYDWKVDGSHQDYGMIAQELVEVAPEAVSTPEDSEEMMGIDYSKLVPMLIKEIQSLRNRVAQLEE